jgi:hypothetical protein
LKKRSKKLLTFVPSHRPDQNAAWAPFFTTLREYAGDGVPERCLIAARNGAELPNDHGLLKGRKNRLDG